MASQGPLYPGTLTSNSGVGTLAWTSPSNAASDNATYASAETFLATETTHYLHATNFGFSIPGGATIDGMQIEIERAQQFFTGSDVSDNVVSTLKGGVVGGDNKANEDAGSWPPTTLTVATYGLSNSLWGRTWTPADINASDFGAVLSAILTSDTVDPSQAYVDFIRIIVYYTDAAVALPLFHHHFVGQGMR
jgi:hypothetical protein